MYESNGPDVKIRGNASHIAEKYLQLARDAQSSGDSISSEAYYQHAEHYFRLIAAAQEHLRQNQPSFYQQQPQQPGQQGEMRGNANDDSFDDDDGDDQPNMAGEPYAPQQQPFYPQQQPPQQQPQQHQPQQQHYQQRPQHFQQTTQDGDVERLPSFITGGQGPQQQAPQQNSPQQNPSQYTPQQGSGSNGPNGPNGSNGYDGQADRFPLHRRRRRHRGPRDYGAQGDNNESPTPPGQEPNEE